MKIYRYLLLFIVTLAVFFVGYIIGREHTDEPPGTVTISRETTVDTISHCAPMPQSELALGTHLYTLPTYRFLGTGAGGVARQCTMDNDSTVATTRNDTTIHLCGTGAGGEPRLCHDSAIVELPMIQRHYADSTYEAWVSGPVDPQLDSINVFARTTVITKREWKPPKHWHIGVTAGYGCGAKGFQPFIGVGITYSIYSF